MRRFRGVDCKTQLFCSVYCQRTDALPICADAVAGQRKVSTFRCRIALILHNCREDHHITGFIGCRTRRQRGNGQIGKQRLLDHNRNRFGIVALVAFRNGVVAVGKGGHSQALCRIGSGNRKGHLLCTADRKRANALKVGADATAGQGEICAGRSSRALVFDCRCKGHRIAGLVRGSIRRKRSYGQIRKQRLSDHNRQGLCVVVFVALRDDFIAVGKGSYGQRLGRVRCVHGKAHLLRSPYSQRTNVSLSGGKTAARKGQS